jgi:hypothetical protein
MFGIDNPSWIFIILGIVVALNSGKIDKAVKSNKKIKKLMVAICCALVLANAFILINVFYGLI